MDSLENFLELGRQMERPRTVSFKLPRQDYDLLADFCSKHHSTMDTLIRGIVLSMICMYRSKLSKEVAE